MSLFTNSPGSFGSKMVMWVVLIYSKSNWHYQSETMGPDSYHEFVNNRVGSDGFWFNWFQQKL